MTDPISRGYIRHVSIRVPWHDRGWDGHVCDEPFANSSCLALKLVAENRKDSFEQLKHGEPFDDLQDKDVPPCLRTSAAFLSPRPYTFESVMAYSKWSRDHEHILPRSLHLPAWGAIIIPYRWMLRKSGFPIAEELELEVHKEREPVEPEWLKRTSWIQSSSNQEVLLNTFGASLKEEESLVFFYATRTPLLDDERRVILGAALLHKKHDIVEYKYKQGSSSPLKAMVWERPIQHTLRPLRGKAGFVGGFVMPYQAVLAASEERSETDIKDLIAFAPEDARVQFSYGSEHVTSGIAAATLISARRALEKTADVLDGPWKRYIAWIDNRLSLLWRMQGPTPGLGPVLSALHPGFNGTLFAISLADFLEQNADVWPIVDEILTGKRKSPKGSPPVTRMLQKRWSQIRSDESRLNALKVLTRFELTKDQAARAITFKSEDILANPYVLFEMDRQSPEPIPFVAIDRGIYPGREIAVMHPLPSKINPDLLEYDNPLRLRAACAELLETAAQKEGHTLVPASQISKACPTLSVNHAIALDSELIELCRDEFAPVVKVLNYDLEIAVQLDRYVESGDIIKRGIESRLKKPLKPSSVRWSTLIEKRFGESTKSRPEEIQARKEKSDALKQLAENQIGVLIGPAGTGKTTILQLLLSRSEIVGKSVRLLAPTGKARVRLGQESQRSADVETVAKFLLDAQRYDPKTGRYYPNRKAGKIEVSTCIVDECSMLTEDMLAALIDALSENCRLILVGDPYQLPPIGAGSPFVDIIEYLQASEGRGLVELKTQMRQENPTGDQGTSALARSDVQLAAIFSGRDLPPGEDEIVSKALIGEDDDHVKYRRWETTNELTRIVRDALSSELGKDDEEIIALFERSLGATKNEKGYINFNRGSSDALAEWQILSATRNTPGGSIFVNRFIKEEFRSHMLSTAIESNRVPHYRNWMRYTSEWHSRQPDLSNSRSTLTT